MKLKVKDMDIATGGVLVVLLNEKDAVKFDLHHEDRLIIKKGKKSAVAIVDVAESGKAVPAGQIGLFEEVLDALNAVNGSIVDISLEEKPASVQYIKKKLDGKSLTNKELDKIVEDIVANKLSEIELTYFISACYTNNLSLDETVALTKAMVKTGDVFKLKRYPIVDKHCSGGVAGNRTTMIIVPIIVAAGLTMPKTSSRSITSPAGTADTMEVLAKVSFPIKKMKQIVNKVGGCIIWGGAINLAPADDKIIKVEHPLGVDAEEQLLASIMAKKKSVSSTHVLIDIPVGRGGKIGNKKEARQLKEQFKVIGKRLGIMVKVITTDGRQPIGNGIGPALEARDILLILKNNPSGPKDLKEKALMMAGLILEMAGKAKKGKGKKIAVDILESGKAYKKMIEIIKAQGGRITDPKQIKIGAYSFDFKAHRKGIINRLHNPQISKIARIAGAPKDKGAGIYLYKHIGDKVKKDETILTVYAENKQKLVFAKAMLKKIDGIVIT